MIEFFFVAKFRIVSLLLWSNVTFFFETGHETCDSFLKLHETCDSFLKLHIKVAAKKIRLNLMFLIYYAFHMKLADKKKVVMAKSHLKARFHMQTGFIFLFYCHTVSAETVE